MLSGEVGWAKAKCRPPIRAMVPNNRLESDTRKARAAHSERYTYLLSVITNIQALGF